MSVVPTLRAMSIHRLKRSRAYSRQAGSFAVKPPSIVRGSSHSRGATNSAASPWSSSVFLRSFACAVICSGLRLLRSGTASSSCNCMPSKPSCLYTSSFPASAMVSRTGGPNGSAPSWIFHGPKEKRNSPAISYLHNSDLVHGCHRSRASVFFAQQPLYHHRLRATSLASYRPSSHPSS